MRLDLVPRGCRLMLITGYALTAVGFALLCIRFPGIILLLAGIIVFRPLRRSNRSNDSHGTARFATYLDALRGGLLSRSGLILGRASLLPVPGTSQAVRGLFDPSYSSRSACRLIAALQHRKRGSRDLIRLSRFVHLSTFAPAGKGKSVSILVPNLLSFPGNCVVTDPKGELHQLTADKRRRKLGHRIVRFDPFGVGGDGSDRFNPLDFIDEHSPTFYDDCRALANLVIMRTGVEKDPHWNDSAERVVCAFVAFVCACETDRSRRNLLTVWALISSREGFLRSIGVMRATTGFGGVVAALGDGLTWTTGDELNSIMSTTQRHLMFLNSPVVAAHLAESSFDPKALRSGSRITLYLCLPPKMLVTLAPLQRLWLGSILHITTQGRLDERNPILFLVDEAAHLGKCQILEDAVTLMRGMGIRLWFFWQSIGQVQICYGESAQVFLDNMDTQIYFGTNSYESAKAIAERIGEKTITVASQDRSSSTSRPMSTPLGQPKDSGSLSRSSSSSRSSQGRQLLKPEEVLGLAETTALIFHRNLPVVAAELLRYYDAPEFRFGRLARRSGLGFGVPVRAAGILSFGCLMSLGGIALSARQEFTLPNVSIPLPAVALPGWLYLPSLSSGPWFARTPERIAAERQTTIDAAILRADRKRIHHNRIKGMGLPVPDQLTKYAVSAELEADIHAAHLKAETQLREYRHTHGKP